MKLSDTVATVSEVTSLMADLIVGKSDGVETDSMLESSSVFSGASSTRVSKSSQVSTWHAHKILSLCK